MKKCPKCKQELDDTKFARNKSRKNGLNSYCKICQKVLKDNHYENNKDSYRVRRKLRKQYIRDLILKIKTGLKCLKCDEQHPACLDFHHKDRKTKKFSISDAVNNGSSIEIILEEINKCDPLCSNCHRKEHWDKKALSSNG